MRAARIYRWRNVALGMALAAGTAAAQAPAPVTAPKNPPITLQVVGGLAGVNQFTQQEEPFWTEALPRLSDGRVKGHIVPFDRAGIRGQDMLRLLSLGVVPFGTTLVSLSSVAEPLLGAPDLAGLNPDMATLRRHTAAFRPVLERALREKHGIELLAVYVYPAQMLFCKQPIDALSDVADRRIRSTSPTHVDWIEGLGGRAVTLGFTEVYQGIRNGSVDCALTGSMTGFTIGLHQVAHHVFVMPVTWGMSIFAANATAWNALPPDIRDLLKRELARLEQDIWASAERETAEGVECLTGHRRCGNGPRAGMIAHAPAVGDDARRRSLLSSTVIPRWVQRCGTACADAWNESIRPINGIEAKP